jgi:hypothetical protein
VQDLLLGLVAVGGELLTGDVGLLEGGLELGVEGGGEGELLLKAGLVFFEGELAGGLGGVGQGLELKDSGGEVVGLLL